MSDSTISIRVNEKAKELFNQLADSSNSENKGDFLNRLLTIYQSESIKSSDKQSIVYLKGAIEAVETLSTRALNILNGTAEVLITRDEKHEEELERQKNNFTEKTMKMQQTIFDLQDEIKQQQDLTTIIKEKEERIEELKINDKNNKTLICRYEKDIETIESKCANLEEELKKLKNEHEALKKSIEKPEKKTQRQPKNQSNQAN